MVSFLPVFLLEAQEGRMFRPLAWTKTLAVGFSSLLAITLVPVLMVMFIRGRLRPESENPISRAHAGALSAGAALCLRYRKTTLLLNLMFLAVTLPLAFGSAASSCRRFTKVRRSTCRRRCRESPSRRPSQLLQEQDRIIRSFPEVLNGVRNGGPV